MQDRTSPSWTYVLARQRDYGNRAAVCDSELDFVTVRCIAANDGTGVPSEKAVLGRVPRQHNNIVFYRHRSTP
jgi:hypothetical protein